MTMHINMIETKQQLEPCAELYKAVFNGEPWNDEWTSLLAYRRLEDIYNSPGFIGVAAFVDQQIAGCIFGNIEQYYTGAYFNLKEMFVTTALQRQGIGQQLFEYLWAHLRQRQITSVLLFTSKDLFPYTFYTRHGFHEVHGMRMLKKAL
jgi:GNAT superfamily N-acetyltransferase